MLNNFINLDDIEIYELLLQGRIRKFPSGFWANRNEEEADEYFNRFEPLVRSTLSHIDALDEPPSRQ